MCVRAFYLSYFVLRSCCELIQPHLRDNWKFPYTFDVFLSHEKVQKYTSWASNLRCPCHSHTLSSILNMQLTTNSVSLSAFSSRILTESWTVNLSLWCFFSALGPPMFVLYKHVQYDIKSILTENNKLFKTNKAGVPLFHFMVQSAQIFTSSSHLYSVSGLSLWWFNSCWNGKKSNSLTEQNHIHLIS